MKTKLTKFIKDIRNEDLKQLVIDLMNANSHAGLSLLTEEQKKRIERLNMLVKTGEEYLNW